MRGLEEMHGVPVVGPAAAFARQIGTDAPRAEHHGPLQYVLILLGSRNRSPAVFLARDRTHELAVAVPAAFAGVDSPAQLAALRHTFLAKPRQSIWRTARDSGGSGSRTDTSGCCSSRQARRLWTPADCDTSAPAPARSTETRRRRSPARPPAERPICFRTCVAIS